MPCSLPGRLAGAGRAVAYGTTFPTEVLISVSRLRRLKRGHPLPTSLCDNGGPLCALVFRQSHRIQTTADPAVHQCLNCIKLVGFLVAVQFFDDAGCQTGAKGVG